MTTEAFDEPTLAFALRNAFMAYAAALADEREARIWRREQPGIDRHYGPIVQRLGGVVFFVDHVPTNGADDTPNIIVRLDAENRLMFFAATEADVVGLLDAERFACDGSLLD